MHNQSIGLPGGPNEYITDISEFVSIEGYKSDSPDVSNPYNIINSSNITMEGVDFPVRGFGNNGIIQDMIPGKNYNYKDADYVVEVPLAQSGHEVKQPSGLDIDAETKFVKDWMNSPMYKEMLINETPIYNKYIDDGRRENLEGTYIDTPATYEEGDALGYALNNGKVIINPHAVSGTVAHEVTHSGDRPLANDTLTANTNVWANLIYKDKRLIPESSVNLLKGFLESNNDNKFWRNALTRAKDDVETNDSRNYTSVDVENFENYAVTERGNEEYYGDPTETRARISEIRMQLKNEGVYDPFTEKLSKEKWLKLNSEIDSLPDDHPSKFTLFKDLDIVYDKDQIFKMLNTISSNDKVPDEISNIRTAQYGISTSAENTTTEDTTNQLVQTANRYVDEEKDTFRTIPLGKREKLLSYLGQSEFYSQNCVQTVKGMICDAEGAGGDEPTIPDDVYDNRTFKANHKEYGYSVVPTEERQPGDLLQYYYSYLEDDEKQWTDFPYHLGVYTGDDQYVSDGSGITGEGAAKKSIFFYDDAELEKKDLFTVYRKLPNKKMGGGLEPKQLDIYTKYISGENNTDEAKKTYDKLNRIYYKQSKDVGMSPANFIMTHVLGNS